MQVSHNSHWVKYIGLLWKGKYTCDGQNNWDNKKWKPRKRERETERYKSKERGLTTSAQSHSSMSSMTEDCDTGIYRGVAPKPHNSNTQTTKTKDCHAQTQRNIRGGAERRIKIDGESKLEGLNHTQSFTNWRPSRVAKRASDAWCEFSGCVSFPLFLWCWHGPTAAEWSSNSSIQFPASLVN